MPGFRESAFQAVPALEIRLRFLADPRFFAALAVYAVFYSIWIAKWTVVRGDDFSYLESVAANFARGRIVTHDWLTPYNALLSVLGAGVFAVSRNFHLATYGILWIFSLFFFASLYLLLRARMAAAVRIDAPMSLAAGYLAFGSLRGAYWDYYLAEPALVALWRVLRNAPGGFRMRPGTRPLPLNNAEWSRFAEGMR
jgi:hypothetical protein